MVNDFEFESSPMWTEIKSVIETGQKKILFDYKVKVHTEKEDIDVWGLESLEVVRDYVHHVGEHSRVVFKIGLGDYIHRLYPYRANLEMTIQRTTLEHGSDERMKSEPILTTRYKAVLNPRDNPIVSTSELENLDPITLNNTNKTVVVLELYDRSLEPLRVKTIWGTVEYKTQEDLIRGLLGGESMKVLVDGKPSIHGFDMVDPDNKEKRKTIIFPDGLHVTAIPTYLQEKEGGVYDGGIGTFIQTYQEKKYWFVYPLYNVRRFDSDDRPKVIFYILPHNKLPNLDRSFFQEGEILKVVCTAQKRYHDSSELNMMNKGSGYRMPDARAFMAKPVDITADGPKGNRKRLLHEVVTKERTDNLNYAPTHERGASMNPFARRSEILAHTLAQVDLVWENADIELIYPGMPCRFTYLNQREVKNLKGTVLFVHALSGRSENLNATAYRTQCRLTLAVEPAEDIPELPVKPSISDNPLESS